MSFIRPLLCLMLALATTSAGAEICRWKDANGRTQYGDTPPPGVTCEGKVRAPKRAAPPAASAEGGGPKSYQEKEMEFRKRRQEKSEAAKKQAEERDMAEQKKAACESARSRVAGLQAGGRVARYDANGEIHYLEDGEIAKELAAAQQAVKEACQ